MRNMRKIFLPLLLLSAISAPAQSLSNADIKELLNRIREKRAAAPSMQADFQEQRKIHLLDEPINSSGRIAFETPNKFRLERKGNAPSITVSNGQLLWIYYPNFKSAERYTLGKRSPLDAAITTITTALNLENVENAFHISGVENGNTYELELVPRNPSMKRIFQKLTLHLNEDLFVSHTDMLQPNSDRIITNYSNPERAPIPANAFEFNPPAGTEVTTPLGR